MKKILTHICASTHNYRKWHDFPGIFSRVNWVFAVVGNAGVLLQFCRALVLSCLTYAGFIICLAFHVCFFAFTIFLVVKVSSDSPYYFRPIWDHYNRIAQLCSSFSELHVFAWSAIWCWSACVSYVLDRTLNFWRMPKNFNRLYRDL